jgi:hypothetical protein
VQTGLINKDQVDKFDHLIRTARHRLWNGWHPSTLADTIRRCHWQGEGGYQTYVWFDTNRAQPYYVQVWFEAEAMYEQFDRSIQH